MHTSNIEHEWFVPGKLLWTSPMRGVEVTELGDGGYYFAPPGDFSKVDFSACQKQEPESITVHMNFVSGTVNEAAIRKLFAKYPECAALLPRNVDTRPKTAQHSKQAKPALPSLMTEAGERYQGLGWCDE